MYRALHQSLDEFEHEPHSAAGQPRERVHVPLRDGVQPDHRPAEKLVHDAHILLRASRGGTQRAAAGADGACHVRHDAENFHSFIAPKELGPNTINADAGQHRDHQLVLFKIRKQVLDVPEHLRLDSQKYAPALLNHVLIRLGNVTPSHLEFLQFIRAPIRYQYRSLIALKPIAQCPRHITGSNEAIGIRISIRHLPFSINILHLH
mmetsp:Transcript_1205/g.3197  ORF Transcript_1205/g.3197 Transcript_1205/m.3197 type:complete len:206 (-) Transcript_1205:168-785(-)